MERTITATSSRATGPLEAGRQPPPPGRSGFSWLVSGNALYSACQWAIVWVLARLGSAEQVGHYALGMAMSGPILLFGNFQLRALIASDLNGDYPLGQYLSFRFVSLGLALTALAAAAFTAQADSWVALAIVLVGAAQGLDLISETYYAVMQREGRLDRLSLSLLVKGPLALGALAAAMYFTRSVLYALAALILARLAVLLAWDARLGCARRKLHCELAWDWRRAGSLLRLALPLGVIAMLVSLSANIPRYFVEAYWGSSALGVFAAVASLMSFGTLVIAAMGQSIFVPVAQACAAGDAAAYRRLAWRALVCAGALGACAICAAWARGEQILAFLLGPEYSPHARLLLVLAAAGAVAFAASALGYVMTAARRLKEQIPLMAAAAATAAGAAAWLVPARGPEGAAVAALAAALVQLSGTAWILRNIGRRLQARTKAAAAMAAGARGGLP